MPLRPHWEFQAAAVTGGGTEEACASSFRHRDVCSRARMAKITATAVSVRYLKPKSRVGPIGTPNGCAHKSMKAIERCTNTGSRRSQTAISASGRKTRLKSREILGIKRAPGSNQSRNGTKERSGCSEQ